jgi:hypothetical protein
MEWRNDAEDRGVFYDLRAISEIKKTICVKELESAYGLVIS